MSIEERAAVAAELKATGKCNCTQSVVKVFEDKLPIDDETLMKLTAGYAAGMGCMESTCGALIGAVMVAGIPEQVCHRFNSLARKLTCFSRRNTNVSQRHVSHIVYSSVIP